MQRLLYTITLLICALTARAQQDFVPTTSAVSVTVGGIFGPYVNESVTYSARLYDEDGVTKLDVTLHAYELPNTQIGDLSLGEYTVCGLTYDEEKGGYFRDYTSDGISFHFSSSGGINGDYVFSKLGNLLVKMNGTAIAYARNTFSPGVMPFPIVADFGTDPATGIVPQTSSPQCPTKGIQKRLDGHRIVIEKNGERYTIEGVKTKKDCR